MHRSDDLPTPERAGESPQRRYDSFVVRLWSDLDDAHRIIRMEVRHVQTERIREAQGVGPAEISVAIGDLLQGRG